MSESIAECSWSCWAHGPALNGPQQLVSLDTPKQPGEPCSTSILFVPQGFLPSLRFLLHIPHSTSGHVGLSVGVGASIGKLDDVEAYFVSLQTSATEADRRDRTHCNNST